MIFCDFRNRFSIAMKNFTFSTYLKEKTNVLEDVVIAERDN